MESRNYNDGTGGASGREDLTTKAVKHQWQLPKILVVRLEVHHVHHLRNNDLIQLISGFFLRLMGYFALKIAILDLSVVKIQVSQDAFCISLAVITRVSALIWANGGYTKPTF